MPESFAPVADRNARILILGTMPSIQSLQKRQYYGNAQNAFWRILFRLWDEPLPDDYEKRTTFLLEKHIALWDVLASCEREGSADTAILHPEPNDFQRLKTRCPHLREVFFNSQNAAMLYKRLVSPDPFTGLAKTILPSTSPARVMRFEQKLECWQSVRLALCEAAE